MRLFATAVTLAIFCFGVSNAEEFTCKITKVDGSKVTLNKSAKDQKVEDVTLTAVKDVKVCKGKWNKQEKKLEVGDAITDGLSAVVFTKASEKAVRATVTTDKDNNITQILVLGKNRKNN